MKLKEMNCPVCGGQIKMEIKDNESLFCPYCGSQLEVDKNETIITTNINIHTKHTDEARILEAKLKDKDKERDYKVIKWMFIGFAAFFIFIFAAEELLSIHETNKATQAIAEGKIKIGISSSDMEGKKYKGIKETLETEGFTNINLVDLDDAGLFKNKRDTIDSVTIDGDSYFSSSDFFEPDVKIIISYH